MIDVALSEDRLKCIDSVALSCLTVAYARESIEIGTDQVRVNVVEIFECLRQTKIDLNDGSKNFAPVCRTVSRLRYRLLFLISRTGNEDAVSGKENCSVGPGFWAGFWVAMDECLKIRC